MKKSGLLDYKKFLLLKPEIEEKINLIKIINSTLPISELKSLIVEGEQALKVIDENPQLLSLFQTHIFSIVALLSLAKQKSHIENIDALMQNIYSALKETHAIHFENPQRLIKPDICHSLLRCFEQLIKLYPMDDFKKNPKWVNELQYGSAQQLYKHLKSQLNGKKLALEIDLFAFALPIISNFINFFTQNSKTNSYYADLENELFKTHCQIYTLYDEHVKLLLPQIEVLHYHLLYHFKLNKISIPELIKLCRMFYRLDNVNEFYQYKKLIALQSLIKEFKDYFNLLHKFSDYNHYDLLLENMLEMTSDILHVFGKIPNEFYFVNKFPKTNYYSVVVREIISTCILVLSHCSLDNEHKLFQSVQNLIQKFNGIIELNNSTEIDEKDSKKILDVITKFIDVEHIAINSIELIPHLKYFANIFTNKKSSAETVAIRDHIINYNFSYFNVPGLMLVSLIQLKEQVIPKLKFQILQSIIFENLATIKNQLLELKSGQILEFEQKAHLNLENSLLVINIFEKRLSETQRLQAIPIEKLSIFILKLLSGLECLSNLKNFSAREKELAMLEEMLNMFETHHRIKKLHLRCYQLQFSNYLRHKKPHTGKIIHCIDKLILAPNTDIVTHQLFIENFLEISIKHSELSNAIFKLATKYLDLSVSQLELRKNDHESKSLLTRISLNVLATMGSFTSVKFSQNAHCPQSILLEKLFHILFPYKMSLISIREHFTILDAIENIFKIPNIFRNLNDITLNALVSLVKIFYLENWKLKYPSLDLALAQSAESKKNIQTHDLVLDSRIISKDQCIQKLKLKLNLVEQEQTRLQHRIKEKREERHNITKLLQVNQVNEKQLKQKFLNEKEELKKKQRENIEKLKTQRRTDLKQRAINNDGCLNLKLKERDKLRASLSEKENNLKLMREQLSLCQNKINSQGLILAQFVATDSKSHIIKKKLDEAYKSIMAYETEIEKRTMVLEKTQSLIQSYQEKVAQINALKESQQNQFLEQVKHSKLLEKELKAVKENKKADQLAFTNASTSLKKRRDELLRSWQPNFVYSLPDQTPTATSFVLYYTTPGGNF